MVSILNEQIRVGAVFEHGGIKPVWFDLKGKKIKITKIFYHWCEKSESSSMIIFKFSVYDDMCVYEICFDPYKIKWTITAFNEYVGN